MNSLTKKLLMYYKIQQLKADKLSISQICVQLGLSWRTVRKYLQMSEPEYLQFYENQKKRAKGLEPYTDFVHQRIEKYPLTSAAQIHDLLKEYFTDFPNVTSKTVYNFTIGIRQTFHLPKTQNTRDFMPVAEPAYGAQAQVDFGVYNLQTADNKRQKIWFFSMCLVRSRYRFVFFSPAHFSTQTAVEAHEKAFEFFEGFPQTVVYDQDRLFISDENLGDYILTELFRQYTDNRKFKTHFCRKSDPQSKGMIENNVKYVKQNFLYGRLFSDIDSLNNQALQWLQRTANALPHSTTKKIPAQEWEIEKSALTPFFKLFLPVPEPCLYSVRKNNTICYKGNFYSLPVGTYTSGSSQVKLQEIQGQIVLLNTQNIEIARHQIPVSKGNIIINNNHKRDNTLAIDQLIAELSHQFEQEHLAKQWLEQIRKTYPRHIRDHLTMVKNQITDIDKKIVNNVLDFCMNNQLFSATEFKDILMEVHVKQQTTQIPMPCITPLKVLGIKAEDLTPQTSDIDIYEQLMS